MLDFLAACLRYGISVCVAGATSSGKTTVAGWLLTTIPDNKRIGALRLLQDQFYARLGTA